LGKILNVLNPHQAVKSFTAVPLAAALASRPSDYRRTEGLMRACELIDHPAIGRSYITSILGASLLAGVVAMDLIIVAMAFIGPNSAAVALVRGANPRAAAERHIEHNVSHMGQF
jgi:hypothetical protein